MQIFGYQFPRAAWMVCFNVLLPVAALAQTGSPTSAPASLSANAQEIVNKGILAAKQQDYQLAIRYFSDARKLAPNASEIYFDLGLAESKIPGRELRAIVCFAAYLAADQNAPNATAVNDEIRTLDIKSHSNVSGFITLVQKTASQIPDASDAEFALIIVAGLWAEAADMTEAKKIADHLQGATRLIQAKMYIAQGQLRAGDIVGARSTADDMLPSKNKYEHDSNLEDRLDVLTSIANDYHKVGDIDGEKETLLNAQKLAEALDDQSKKKLMLGIIASAQATAGDIAAAQGTSASAQKIKTGDKSAENALDKAKRDLAWAIGKGDGDLRDFYKRQHADFVKKQQSQPAVSGWLEILDYKRNVPWDFVGLNTAPFLDFAGYLTAQRSDNPKTFHDALVETAKILIKAQNEVDGMLKRQAKK